MDFNESQKRYSQLKGQLNSNDITYEEFRMEVEKLCFQTSDNTWWRIREHDGAWIWWDGEKWIEYIQENDLNTRNKRQSKNSTNQINYKENNEKNMQQNKVGNREALPDTFLGLLLYILKKIPVTLIKRLPMTIGIGLITWTIHTYLLVGPNGGFNPGPYSNLAQILALKGNKISGSLFWFFGTMGMTMILKQVFSGNTGKLITQIMTTPKYIISVLKKGEDIEKIVTVIACTVVIFFSVRFGNKYLNLVTGSVFYLALQNWKRNFLFVIFKMAWSDIKKWFFDKNKKLEINYNIGIAVYSGITLGFFIGGLLSGYRIIANLIVIGLIGFVIYLMNNKNEKATLTMLIMLSGIIVYSFSNEYIAFADDGGFVEAGGTFSSWIVSQGALIAILMGLFPSLAAILSSLLSNLGIDISSLLPDDDTGEEEEEENNKKVWIEIMANPKEIKADGEDVSWVYAKVCSSDPEIDAEELTSYINFDVSGEYSYLLGIGEPQYTSGYKAINVSANVNQNESYPPSASVSIIASVNGPEGLVSKATTLSLELPGEIKLEMATNPEKKAIAPDGKTGIWVYARPVPSGANNMDEKILNEILDSITFSTGGEGAAWADLSEPTYVDNWRCVYVQASNTDGSKTGNNAPQSFSIISNAILGEKTINENVVIELLPMAELDVDNDKLSFLKGSKGSETIKVQIKNASQDSQWSFRTVIKEMSKDVVSIIFEEEENTYATIVVEECGEAGNKGERSVVRGSIVICADYEDITLEREVSVYIAAEGIFVSERGRNSDGSFRLKADGKSTKEIGFTVYRWDESNKELIADKSYLDQIQLDFETPEGDKAFELNCLNVAEPTGKFSRISDTSVPVGYYEITTSKEIPGTGKVALLKINASLEMDGKEDFNTQATLGLETINIGPGSEAWQIEYDACVNIINKYVPTEYKDKVRSILETRKMTLDAAGMYVMKRKIWSIAESLMQGEGGQGYLEEAKWADRIVTVLEWWEWAGDLAFDAVVGTFAGPVGAVGASVMKSMIISAIRAYQENQTASEWLWEQIKGYMVMGVDMALDPDRTAQAIGKAKAWALFVCYKFIYGLYEGQSVKDAIYGAAKAAGENVLGNWLNDKVKASAKKNGYKVYEGGDTNDDSDEGKKSLDNDGTKPKDHDGTKSHDGDGNKTKGDDGTKSNDGNESKTKDGEKSKDSDDSKSNDKDSPKDNDTSKDGDNNDKPDDAKHKPKKNNDDSRDTTKDSDAKNKDSEIDKSKEDLTKQDKSNKKETDFDNNKNSKDNGDESKNKGNDDTNKDAGESKNKDNDDTKNDSDDSKNKADDDTKNDSDDSKNKDNDDGKNDSDESKNKDKDYNKNDGDDSNNKDKNDDKNKNKDDKDKDRDDKKDDGKENDNNTDDIEPGETKKIKTPVGEVTISKDANGKAYMSESDVLKIKQNTQASRSLKDADPSVREAYNNTLKEKIYDPHDRNVENWIKEKVNGVKDDVKTDNPQEKRFNDWVKRQGDDVKNAKFEVEEIRTPGKKTDPTDINTDRDYRVVYTDANGKKIEVPKEFWRDQSVEEFAKSSNYSEQKAREDLHSDKERAEFDKLSDHEKKEKWAEMHHQAQTDRAHIEASKDYSDQGIDWKTGKDLDESIIEKVKRGESKLNDPDGLGSMFEEKVDVYVRNGNAPEALAQAKKAVETLDKVREGYSKNYDIGNLPTRLKNAMDIVSESKSDLSATPEYMKNIDNKLKEQGFRDIGDFMDKLSGQFASLKWAVKK